MAGVKRPFEIGQVFKITEPCKIDRPKYYPGGGYSFEVRNLVIGTIIRYAGTRYIGSDSCYEEIFEVITGNDIGFVGALPNCWGSTYDHLLDPVDIVRHPEAK